jgi:hypothetical protein
MLAYARQEPFDSIVLVHDPHHLHWFAEAGLAPAAFIPALNIFHYPQPFKTYRKPHIAFVGQVGMLHPRRLRLLQAMKSAGLPTLIGQGPTDVAAAVYADAQITFNCSLNGDLNMRIFEVIGAGGFLMTDRLSPQSGLETLLPRGEAYADYESTADLIDKLR